MAAIDTFLAGQRGPNLLGAFNKGVQVNNLQELNALKLAQAQQQAPIDNQFQLNRLQQQDQNFEQGQQRLDQGQQNLQLGQQNIAQGERRVSNAETKDAERKILRFSALMGDNIDVAQFENLVNTSNFLNDEDKQFALEFGPEGVKNIVKQIQGNGDNDRVVRSQINEDGSIILVRAQSGPQVIPANEVDSEVLRQAREFDVETKQKKAQAGQLGKDAAKFSNEAISTVSNINKNILNLREVIDIIEVDGADTGPLAKLTPNITEAANRLENIAGRLAIDVVSAVTFGALSAGELRLARDIGLPTGLQGPALVKWAKERIDAQEKLASYLNEAAQFTAISGNTVAGFTAKKQAEKDARDAQLSQSQQSTSQPFTVGRFQIETIN